MKYLIFNMKYLKINELSITALKKRMPEQINKKGKAAGKIH